MALTQEVVRSTEKNSSRGRARLLYILPREDFFSYRSGRVTHALGVVTGMVAQGIKVTILSGEGVSQYLRKEDDVACITVKALGNRWIWVRNLLTKLRAILQEDPPDFVVVRYAASNGFRFAQLMKEFDNTVWCFELNSLGIHAFSRVPEILRLPIKRWESGALQNADVVYLISNQLKHDLSKTNRSLEEKTVVVPNGAPPAFDVNRAKPSEEAAVQFYYLGLFHGYYELELVVRAVRSLKEEFENVELHLYGEGPCEVQIRKAIGGSPGIHMHGRYRLEDVVENGKLSTDGVLLLPYSKEGVSTIGSPTKLFEYMALGLPIVASRTGQVGEILSDNETAILYHASNEESLKESLRKMAENSDLRQRIGANIRAEHGKHTWPSRMEVLLHSLKEKYSRKTAR